MNKLDTIIKELDEHLADIHRQRAELERAEKKIIRARETLSGVKLNGLKKITRSYIARRRDTREKILEFLATQKEPFNTIDVVEKMGHDGWRRGQITACLSTLEKEGSLQRIKRGQYKWPNGTEA